jgi:hypothetical protein
MTRWLEAAKQPPMPADKTDLTDLTPHQGEGSGSPATASDDKSVKSVKSGRGVSGGTVSTGPAQSPDGLPADTAAYLDFLQRDGPSTYGAAAVALGWGATRAWLAEAQLKAAGLVRNDIHGKTHLVADRGPQCR